MGSALKDLKHNLLKQNRSLDELPETSKLTKGTSQEAEKKQPFHLSEEETDEVDCLAKQIMVVPTECSGQLMK